ncbi:hypothetical protein J3A83DRAFT_4237226 [Scleroderma citrinum]
MRLYALYHCSKRLLGFMLVTFMTEVGVSLWILVSNSHAIDVHRGANAVCSSLGNGITEWGYIWVPGLIFETMLCLFSVCVGVKHSRGRPHHSVKFNRFQLMDVLVQGNVLYFLSPLIAFVAILISLIRWSFLETEAI